MNISSSTDEKNISQAPIKKNTPVKQTHFRMGMYQDHFVKKKDSSYTELSPTI